VSPDTTVGQHDSSALNEACVRGQVFLVPPRGSGSSGWNEEDLTPAFLVQLARAPDVGETLELPHGGSVIVRHVISGHADVVAGIVLAGPASA
jgi:hypothetical protein